MLRVIVVALACSVFVCGQEPLPAMRSSSEPGTPARVGVGITQRQLSVTDVIAMAVENNLDVDIERTNRDTAAQNVRAARGFFDPGFRWQPLLQTVNTPTGSVLQGAGGKLTDKGFAQNFYIRQQLPKWGTALNLDFENSRATTTNPFTSFSPLTTTRLLAGITQPLVRGFRIDRNRAELLIRAKRVDLSNVDLETRVIDVVTRTEQSYWDLVAARQAVAVAEESANLAREQLAINRRLVEAGTLAPVELAAAEAELERRLDTWYSNVGALTEVENALKALIAPERLSSLWNDEIVPTDFKTGEPGADDLRELVKTALAKRTELRAVGVRQQINNVEKDLNENLRKPEVSLVGQYWLSGLGGSIVQGDNPFTSSNAALYQRMNQLSAVQGWSPIAPPSFGAAPGFLVGSYGTALSNLFGGNYQSFQVGLSIDFNFRNRTADANYGNTLIAEKRLKLERARAEQLIEAQVRNALQGIYTARQRIAAAEASARAAKEKLDSETRLFQTGESTNFLVLTRQNEYADSRRREVVARLDLNKSISRLDQAIGSTLSTYQIVLK